MEKYEVILRKQPEKYLKKLAPKIRNRFQSIFLSLESNPFLRARLLRGPLEGLYKIRISDWRMIVRIDQKARTVDVLEIGPRGDIYK